MRKLTEEESRLVEENHNLIYWVANLKGLDIDEWYGLLAEELCITIQKHDPERSKLSWFYKQRVDWRVHREHEKTKQKKAIPLDIFVDVEDYDQGFHDEDYDLVEIAPWVLSLSPEDRGIIELKAQGMTQREIATMIGCSKSKVGMILKRLKGEYDVYRQADSGDY